MKPSNVQPEFRHPGARFKGAPRVLSWSEMLPGVRFHVACAWGGIDSGGGIYDSTIEILATGTVTGEPFTYTAPEGVEPNQSRFADGTLVVSVRWEGEEEPPLIAANAWFGFAYQSETINHDPVCGNHFCVVAD